MAIFTQDTVDSSKIESYLYELNENLTYMFNNLTPEENFTLFISLLSQYSGKDVRAMFTDAEWANAMKVGSL